MFTIHVHNLRHCASLSCSRNEMISSDKIEARAASLRKEATRRWLVKDELMFLLLHYKLVRVPVLHSLQLRPPSGTLLFYNTLDVLDYKKDGWHWQKRKDKSGRVREDRAKLVINREIIILGTYVHSAETSTFHRRVYSLRDSKENIILVHYFDDVNKKGMGRHVFSGGSKPSKGVKRSLPVTTASMTLFQQPNSPKSISPEESAECTMDSCFDMFEPQNTLLQNSSIRVSDADVLLPNGNGMDGITTEFCVSDLFYDLDCASSTEKSINGVRSQQTFELAEIVDFSPDWDFGYGGAKILICLAAKLPVSLAQDLVKLFVQFGAKRVRAEKVSNTVLRCSAPSSQNLGSVDIYVCHWNGTPQHEIIQLSHKAKFTYRSHYQVSPSLVDDIANDKRVPEARAPDPLKVTAPFCAVHDVGMGKRGRSPAVQFRPVADSKRSEDNFFELNNTLSSYVESDLDKRQCKIRVVERLSEFHHAMRTKSAEPAVNSNVSDAFGSGDGTLISQEQRAISRTSVPVESSATLLSSSETSTSLDDCTIEALSDKELEQLSEKLLERVVRQLVTVAHTDEELLEELNSLDKAGLSLLHYVSFYNYSQLVPVLVAHGARINQQSTQGQTALHLAAGCGHEEVVDVLQQSGVDLQAQDFDGLTAADRAEKSGHAHVAAKLRRHMGHDTSSDLGVIDGVCGFGGSQMEIDDAPTPYMDAGDMGLLECNDHAVHYVRLPCSHSNSCEGLCEASLSSKAISYVGENQEHNRKLLLGAFSTMSLHDKCALSLSLSRDSAGYPVWCRKSSVGEDVPISPTTSSTGTAAGFGSSPVCVVGMEANLVGGRQVLSAAENDSDVQSVIAEDEDGLNKLQAAMELMGPEERQLLEDEVKVLQHGIRAWLLRRNCKNMREATKQLREAAQSIEQQEAKKHLPLVANEQSERERAAVTVQAAMRSMLARRSFLQTKHVAIKFQAATRGALCRKHFARMKAHALASLVIQRNVREWWNKQPTASRPGTHGNDADDNEEEEKTPIPPEEYPVVLPDEVHHRS